MRWVLLLSVIACGEPQHPVSRPAPTASSVASAQSVATPRLAPPVAPRHPHVASGRSDDYFWLRDKGSPEVLAYLAAENAYADEMARPFEPLAAKLYDEMLARIDEDDSTVPMKRGEWLYYRRFEKGKQYPIRCRKRAAGGPEVVLIDDNELGKNEKFIDVDGPFVSDDGNQMAYLVDTQGFRQYVLKTEDLRTRKAGPEAIARVDSVAWAKDSKTLFYVTEDAQTKRGDHAFRHVLGDDPAKDALVYHEADEMFDLEVERTLDHAYVLFASESRTTTEVRFIDASKPTSPPRVVAPREPDHEYFVAHRGSSFYIRTNSGGRNFRVVTAPDSDPRRASWKELVPHRDDVMLEDMTVFASHLVLFERRDALSRIELRDFKTNATRLLDQPEPVYEVSEGPNAEFDAKALRIKYQSFISPPATIDVDMTTGARAVLKEDRVLGGYDKTKYESKRITTVARDGTPIPVSLVYAKGTQPDATHPVWLDGYGSYGIPYRIRFSSDRVSLLDRGFVYAVAHVRGGGDMGKKWHDSGRMKTKMNTFTDFIDVAEGLKKSGWARPDAIVASGGSAGGLLMGAIANMRPDLFRVVLAYVPFVDVVNTMLDETLPLTVQEFEEWGNPKKPDELAYILQYSPYDNVKPQRYPTMLVRSSYNDSQVMYWEPAKWVAKLRANKTDDHELLFKIQMQPAGHGGQSGRYDKLRDEAFDYAFVVSQVH